MCEAHCIVDILARLSTYLLSEPSLSFAPLLKPLLTPQSIPETLVVILLNWSDPYTWIRHVREWVRFLRSVLVSLDDEAKMVMEETIVEWRDRRRGVDSSGPGGGSATIPLGPGEWDEALGVPMCVVCQGVCSSFQIWDFIWLTMTFAGGQDGEVGKRSWLARK